MSNTGIRHDQATLDDDPEQAAKSERIVNIKAHLLLYAPVAGYFLASPLRMDPILGALIGLVVAWVWLFLLVFTGRPTANRMRWMVRYCYLFCFLSVVATILPFFLLDASTEKNDLLNHKDGVNHKVSTHQDETTDELKSYLKLKSHLNRFFTGNNAIGVVVGCREHAGTQATLQSYVDCNKTGYQWVVHIGGMLKPEHHSAADVAGAKFTEHGNGPRAQAVSFQPQLQHVNYQVSMSEKRQSETKHYKIEGGIIFPLYLIVISLIGGAVSLTRRVPEIQCHLWENIRNASMHDLYKTRQNLILQMMQFISAPFVAIIAFSILEPTSIAMGVGAAFLSGFASEYVLLTISNVFDKLKPATATTAVPPNGGSAG